MADASRRGPLAITRFGRESRGKDRLSIRTIPLVDTLTAFGAVAVTAMLMFYALEPRSPRFVLAFAVACLASSAYGFLQGAWPFGVVELIWSGVAARRWWLRVSAARC